MEEVGTHCIVSVEHAIPRHGIQNDESIARVGMSLSLIVFEGTCSWVPALPHPMRCMNVALIEVDDDMRSANLQSQRSSVLPNEAADACIAVLRCEGTD